MPHKPKILYIHFEDVLNPNKSGVINKIKGQTEALTKLGYQTDMISFRSKNKLYYNDKCILTIPSRILLFRYVIFQKLLSVIEKDHYTFIYIRYFGSDHAFIRFLRKVFSQQIKVFLEFPTFPYDQEVVANNPIERLIFFLDRSFRSKISSYVYRAVSFTYEGDILNIPTLKLENGVSVEKLLLTERSADKSSLHMIGVANVSRWHGYDRILRGMHAYLNQSGNNFPVTFTIVGSGNSLDELKALCKELHLEKQVLFTGPKSGRELDEAFRNANMAIGSLGMHRIGLLKGSVLKLGEYFARGFPVVVAYDDFSIKEDVPFVLKIEPDDAPADIQKLIDFHSQIVIAPEKIREYAFLHFSWDQKMRKIVDSL